MWVGADRANPIAQSLQADVFVDPLATININIFNFILFSFK